MIQINQPYMDNAILQRNQDLFLSGRSDGNTVCVKFYCENKKNDAISETITIDHDKKWKLYVGKHAAGGPYIMEISNDLGERLHFQNLFFGDVFLLCGQSNMELPVSRTLEKASYNLDLLEDNTIRELRLPNEMCFDTDNECIGKNAEWKSLSPDNVNNMGALGLAAAVTYKKFCSVPIGLINCALGGTPILSWLPHLTDEKYKAENKRFHSFTDPEDRAQVTKEIENENLRWMQEAIDEDIPIYNCSKEKLDTLDWQEIYMPKMFFNTPFENKQGVFWLRVKFSLTDNEYKQLDDNYPTILELGAFKDSDRVYLNGAFVGETGYQYPPRKYQVSKEQLKIGENDLLIRLTVPRETGGATEGKFYGIINHHFRMHLPNNWKIIQTVEKKGYAYRGPWEYTAGACYYSFIRPLQNFNCAAILWYQGESDAGKKDYGYLFEKLIKHYHNYFYQAIPFFYVQLPVFDDPAQIVKEPSWAEIREAQRICSKLPYAEMIVSLDTGDPCDLHPQDKWTLGERLGRRMLAVIQDKYNGSFQSMDLIAVKQFQLDEIQIQYNCPIMKVKGRLNGAFCLTKSSEDKISSRYIENISIESEKIILKVKPALYEKIYYLYENAPMSAYLYNKDGFMAGPYCEEIIQAD